MKRWRTQGEDIEKVILTETAADAAQVKSLEILEASDRVINDRVGTPRDDCDYFQCDVCATADFGGITEEVSMNILAIIRGNVMIGYQIIGSC